ncbi:hypothetical protein SUGI_0820320 [Cryptomeria japonica]|nr:hypothetical protein SUGI_0820320 [Cryptomeria japonica]
MVFCALAMTFVHSTRGRLGAWISGNVGMQLDFVVLKSKGYALFLHAPMSPIAPMCPESPVPPRAAVGMDWDIVLS